jgi:hypothetical protein
MAAVVNRQSLQLLPSVDTTEYPEPQWKVVHQRLSDGTTVGSQADVDAIRAIDQRYRKLDNRDNVVEMTQPEKDAVDAALKQSYVDAEEQRFTLKEDLTEAGLSVLLDYINAVRAALVPAQPAVDETTFLTDVRAKISSDYVARSK